MTSATAPSRLRGILRATERGYRLETDDGHIWRVEGAVPAAELVDRSVVVEAYRRTATLLDLLWIGPAE
ncbi:DUF5818 domain-containing protein [Sandaracinobacter sp. RS1-74]|uniref:DUF5818 domain-containing protein n=1 Tax=Sandaracinobacteroides sayramensis TaxID=2913411 RepID=UPI001EDA3F3B|nr:DUF5818 domain-containing protein [Sandaracinobacteroides sayramensis]MCG2841280.1 DUF5818 domain-containing protein [Sandaracinobacteroides sayramensis]